MSEHKTIQDAKQEIDSAIQENDIITITLRSKEIEICPFVKQSSYCNIIIDPLTCIPEKESIVNYFASLDVYDKKSNKLISKGNREEVSKYVNSINFNIYDGIKNQFVQYADSTKNISSQKAEECLKSIYQDSFKEYLIHGIRSDIFLNDVFNAMHEIINHVIKEQDNNNFDSQESYHVDQCIERLMKKIFIDECKEHFINKGTITASGSYDVKCQLSYLCINLYTYQILCAFCSTPILFNTAILAKKEQIQRDFIVDMDFTNYLEVEKINIKTEKIKEKIEIETDKAEKEKLETEMQALIGQKNNLIKAAEKDALNKTKKIKPHPLVYLDKTRQGQQKNDKVIK